MPFPCRSPAVPMLFPCRYPAVPLSFPCHAVPLRFKIVSFPFDLHSAAVFDSHIPCRSHAVPLPCHEYAFLKATSQGHSRVVAGSRQGDSMGTAWERHGMCELASAVQRRNVGDLPAFGFFLLPCGVPGKLLSEAYQSQMQVASVKQCNVCRGRREAYYFGAKTCLLV
jgi:hypothetical protein